MTLHPRLVMLLSNARHVLFCLAVFLVLASRAEASTITLYYTGVVTFTDNAEVYLPGLEVGDQLFGTLIHDPADLGYGLATMTIGAYTLVGAQPLQGPGFFGGLTWDLIEGQPTPAFASLHKDVFVFLWDALHPEEGAQFVLSSVDTRGFETGHFQSLNIQADIQFAVPDASAPASLMLLSTMAFIVMRRRMV